MEIFQIVPGLPPSIDGVGDYAFLLAQQLRAAHGVNTQFVVCDPNWENAETLKPEMLKSGLRPPTSLDGFPVHQLRERTAAELLRVLSKPGMPTTVLLQFVGYGYEKRGCPVWLAKALGAWRKAQSGQWSVVGGPPPRRLLTMFHELYAFGPAWRSSFWTSPVQRWIAQTLARNSDCCFTNRATSATWLAAASQHLVKAISVLPVFSNLGEPESLLPLALRKPQMLIYGGLSRSPNDRDLATEAICHACNRLGIERLVAFGSKTLDPASVSFPVENVGVLTRKEAGKLLSESKAGYLDYFDGYLAKSGVFSSYCGYGIVPFLLYNNHSEADGLEPGKYFWIASALPSETGIIAQQSVADQARKWYGRHSVAETARAFAEKLKNNADLFVEA